METKKNRLIVFCGLDGTGKTTLAKKLGQYLNKQGLKYHLIHAHGYTFSQNSFGLNSKKVKDWRLFFRALIPFALLDNLFTYFFKFKPILKKKSLICDRYFYDKLARMIFYGISNQFLAKIYLKLLPKPDFVFFLDIDPKKAFLRKKEYPENQALIFRKIYQFLAQELKAPIINTSLSLNTCLKKIVKTLS